ncbi:MAG: DUF935 family protein [Kiritimatiellae bacterium]|nr:DUF935 family protein [Kiritimatiellia bacterium]
MSRKQRNVASVVTPQMIETYLRSRQASPIDLTPERLRLHLDAFERGWLQPLAQTMEQIKDLDDLLPILSFKREVAPAVHGWEVLTVDDSATAKRHKKAIEDFYNNVRCVNAVDEDERGEMSLLLRQMMFAVGYRYSLHEINWLDLGNLITAEFRYVPLQFFERRTGRLRFCPTLMDYNGIPLEPERWLVTVGQGIMKACAIAYYYKHQPLRDWLIYCAKHGMPGTAGKTTAQPGSDQWKAMEVAVAAFAAEFAAVMSKDDSIEPIDLTAKGNIPHPALVDRMDRALTILWRGGDLSTMSSVKGEGRGASLMEGEMEMLDAADSMMLSEALRMYVDRPLIMRRFGQTPLAYISICTGTKTDSKQEMEIDNHFYNMGVALSRRDLYERHNRAAPKDEEDTVQKLPTDPLLPTEPAANEAQPPSEKLIERVNDQYIKALAADTRPLAERLAALLVIDDDNELTAAIQELEKDFPEIAGQVLDADASVKVLDDAQKEAMA